MYMYTATNLLDVEDQGVHQICRLFVGVGAHHNALVGGQNQVPLGYLMMKDIQGLLAGLVLELLMTVR